jgi:Na+-driven multidrug efflux pump
MLIQLIVAGFNVVVNLWIIRAYSWRGAAWSSIASDGLLVALLWLAIVLLRREQEESMGTVVPVGVTTGEML